MFLQLVTPPGMQPAQPNIDSLFLYHPLQLSAIVETFWRNRYNALNAAGGPNSPFVAWPLGATQATWLIQRSTYVLGYNSSGIPNTDTITGNPTGQLFMPSSAETFVAPTSTTGYITSSRNGQFRPPDLRISDREYADLRHFQ